jgi:hypothetical protein
LHEIDRPLGARHIGLDDLELGVITLVTFRCAHLSIPCERGNDFLWDEECPYDTSKRIPQDFARFEVIRSAIQFGIDRAGLRVAGEDETRMNPLVFSQDLVVRVKAQ